MTRFRGCKSSLLWNFNFKLHMHVDGGHRQKPIDFSEVTFKMAAWWPYWIFLFPDSKFSLALNINSKLKWHNTYVYV